MKCTVEDIPESELLRWASLSDAERLAEFDLICKENSAAVEELMASQSFISHCHNSIPSNGREVGMPLLGCDEFVFGSAPINPNEHDDAS